VDGSADLGAPITKAKGQKLKGKRRKQQKHRTTNIQHSTPMNREQASNADRLVRRIRRALGG
jgi:hypothetical protein